MFYDRAGTDTARRPKYLLLFGDGTFDPLNRLGAVGQFIIPAWQSPGPLDPLSTYTTDDFYALLDDDEDINDPLRPGLPDIGDGSIPSATAAEARTFLDTAIRQPVAPGRGSWW